MPRRQVTFRGPESLPTDGTLIDIIDFVEVTKEWAEEQGVNPGDVMFTYEAQHDDYDEGYIISDNVKPWFNRMETHDEMEAREERERLAAEDRKRRDREYRARSLRNMFQSDPDFVREQVIQLIQEAE